eukprot:NODE_224_length_2098_cov_84.671059_g192_i0.p2 GENE.NODE_224_length_2098_cov_84.671059_g192_i0~~NODE_224_length_2098_cov_84.671059_g192_i0.p2  ORF type:complete len:89 (-),score=12.92 NODE_224_length_2098_cov_84.671059_g192_i0:46-312(-)
MWEKLSIDTNLDWSGMKVDDDGVERLYPAGACYHMTFEEGVHDSRMFCAPATIFENIILAPGMFTDHLPTAYESAIDAALKHASVPIP